MPTASSSAALARPRPGRLSSFALAALVGFFAADFFQAPQHQVGARLALLAIDGYRATVSPLLARTHLIGCRFHPTCSAYGREAVARYGMPRGALLAARRVLRCHPFAKGGEDPVP